MRKEKKMESAIQEGIVIGESRTIGNRVKKDGSYRGLITFIYVGVILITMLSWVRLGIDMNSNKDEEPIASVAIMKASVMVPETDVVQTVPDITATEYTAFIHGNNIFVPEATVHYADEETVLFQTKNYVSALRRTDGEELWKMRNRKAMFLHAESGMSLLEYNGTMYVLYIESGDVEWEVEVDDPTNVRFSNGLAVLQNGDYLKAFDIVTGQEVWRSEPETLPFRQVAATEIGGYPRNGE
jgi:outer membrane protein assembly factor BamB